MRPTEQDVADQLLVLQSQAGDEAALEALVQRWQQRLLALAWRITRDREAARDVTQEAWFAIVRGLRRLDDPARFPAWAARIVANRGADWLRRRVVDRAARKRLAGESALTELNTAGPASEADDPHDVMQLRGALGRLAEDERTLLSLHYLDGLGLREISQVLRIPLGTVKSRLFAAREVLRQSMTKEKP
jgi:RNA polymerase sigma-70 factor (ECF subfamily)